MSVMLKFRPRLPLVFFIFLFQTLPCSEKCPKIGLGLIPLIYKTLHVFLARFATFFLPKNRVFASKMPHSIVQYPRFCAAKPIVLRANMHGFAMQYA